jgi:hypothetical protein
MCGLVVSWKRREREEQSGDSTFYPTTVILYEAWDRLKMGEHWLRKVMKRKESDTGVERARNKKSSLSAEEITQFLQVQLVVAVKGVGSNLQIILPRGY